MKIKLVAVTLLSLSTIAAIPACAQTIKPGLWEMKMSIGKGFGKDLAALAANNKKMYAAMSAQDRKELEGLEAEQADEIRYTDDHVITKECITKAQTAKLGKMLSRREGNCTEQHSPMVGGVIKINYSCTNPQSTGVSTIRLRGDSFDMESTSTTPMKGQQFTTRGTASGKWLGTNCGKIEPGTEEE